MKESQSPTKVAARASEPRAVTEAARPRALKLSPGRAAALPLGFAAVLAVVALAPAIRNHPHLFPTFLGAAGALVVWVAAFYATARRAGRTLMLEVAVRKHHWVQACAHATIFAYWGWYERWVYAFVPLILVQVVFAYAVDSLLTWSRRDTYALGFGPLPIIGSINLFLWFKPDWFHWQFVMIAVGYLGKELIRWKREGRSAHIFNPSSLPLAVFSLVLILLGATETTFGLEIATTQFNPPHIYLLIFLVSLPAQILFGVARMTLSAVVTMYLIGLLYFKATGTYLAFDSFIPLPVFLGMHLLFTDPSTSPRSESGRIFFGVLYALGTIAFYVLLNRVGAPSFYDKLLPVPLMNLTVRGIDRLAASRPFARLDPSRIGRALTPRQRHVAYTSIWAGVFVLLSAVQGVGDKHPGQYLAFWRNACQAGSGRACKYVEFKTFVFCGRGSGWACNEWGARMIARGRVQQAGAAFKRGCDLGFSPACDNQGRDGAGNAPPARAGPLLADLPIVLRGSKGPIREQDPSRLYALACEQGWPGMCDQPAPAARH